MIDDGDARALIAGIVEKIKREYEPERIILFGSHASGSAERDSDIVLLIIKDTQDRPIDRRVAVRKIVSDRRRLIPFEPMVLTPHEVEERLEIGDQFVKGIIEKGEVLYAA